jgi:hypothetical protein
MKWIFCRQVLNVALQSSGSKSAKWNWIAYVENQAVWIFNNRNKPIDVSHCEREVHTKEVKGSKKEAGKILRNISNLWSVKSPNALIFLEIICQLFSYSIRVYAGQFQSYLSLAYRWKIAAYRKTCKKPKLAHLQLHFIFRFCCQKRVWE